MRILLISYVHCLVQNTKTLSSCSCTCSPLVTIEAIAAWSNAPTRTAEGQSRDQMATWRVHADGRVPPPRPARRQQLSIVQQLVALSMSPSVRFPVNGSPSAVDSSSTNYMVCPAAGRDGGQNVLTGSNTEDRPDRLTLVAEFFGFFFFYRNFIKITAGLQSLVTTSVNHTGLLIESILAQTRYC